MRASRSIATRLLAGLVAGVGALLVIAGVIASTALSRHERVEFDSALLAKARALATLTKTRHEGLELDFADEMMPEFSARQAPDYFELRGPDGASIERSRSLRSGDLPYRPGTAAGSRFEQLTLPDGRSGRLVQLDFEVHPDDDATGSDTAPATGLRASIVVAHSRQELDRLLLLLRIGLAGATVLILLLTVPLARWAVRRGLHPLEELNGQLARMDATDLTARLHSSQPYAETGEIVAQFNALLARLQAAFERERAFSANAAHELRTPIAEMRNLAEVGAQWSEDAALAKSSFLEIAAATRELERLVVALLAIARSETRGDAGPGDRIDLRERVEAAISRHTRAAAARQVRLLLDGSAPAAIRTAPELLDRILDNLLDNAIEYTPTGAGVTTRIAVSGRRFELSVSNPAPGLAGDELERMLEPLWRKDAARAGGGHLGLGLNLVRAYAAQLGLDFGLTLDGGLFVARLRGGLADEAGS